MSELEVKLDWLKLKSGGAEGSDRYWGVMGKKYGMEPDNIEHLYVLGHPTPYGTTPIEPDKALKADDDLKSVAEFIGRKFPTGKPKVDALLRRNRFQVPSHQDVVLAVGEFDDNGIIKGGTAWACYLALLKHVPLYFFDQNEGKWYYTDHYTFFDVDDTPSFNIDKAPPFNGTPTLESTTDLTGVGTRYLKDNGRSAIEQVFVETIHKLRSDEVEDL